MILQLQPAHRANSRFEFASLWIQNRPPVARLWFLERIIPDKKRGTLEHVGNDDCFEANLNTGSPLEHPNGSLAQICSYGGCSSRMPKPAKKLLVQLAIQ